MFDEFIFSAAPKPSFTASSRSFSTWNQRTKEELGFDEIFQITAKVCFNH
jgi:hypothetical protein